MKPAPDAHASSETIETAVVQGRERILRGSESLVTMLESTTLAHEAHASVLALEALLAEALYLSAWMLHLRGQHDEAHEIVHTATNVQRAVSELLLRE